MLRRCLKDIVIEPQRSEALPYFDPVKAAAADSGALGCSLSGSGPSMFALCEDGIADSVRAAMLEAVSAAGITGQAWISPLNAPGATVVVQ